MLASPDTARPFDQITCLLCRLTPASIYSTHYKVQNVYSVEGAYEAISWYGVLHAQHCNQTSVSTPVKTPIAHRGVLRTHVTLHSRITSSSDVDGKASPTSPSSFPAT